MSKAIIIAGGILVGIFIISVSMYMLTGFRALYDESMTEFEVQQITSFNSFFTQYPSVIKGYDAYNIIGKINDVNADDKSDYFITFASSTGVSRETSFYYTENFSKNFSYSYSFDADGIVSRVVINELP